MELKEYRDDYPTKPIGGDNPYHCCLFCGRSVPEINGNLNGHYHWCEWMKAEKQRQKPLSNPAIERSQRGR